MDNVYGNQLIVFKSLAVKYNLPEKKGLPDISFDFIQSFSTSRINYKNQWASHPGLRERKEHLTGWILMFLQTNHRRGSFLKNQKKTARGAYCKIVLHG